MRHILIIILSLLCFSATAKTNTPAESDGWKIRTNDYSASPYYGTVVGNGGIGILPWKEPFAIKEVILNSVFDSKQPMGISSILKGINPFNLQLTVDDRKVSGKSISDWSQTIDMRNAVHSTKFKFGNDAEITYDIRALRNMPYAGLVTVSVHALKDISLTVKNTISMPDMYRSPTPAVRHLTVDGQNLKILRVSAPSKNRAVPVSASASFLFDDKTPDSDLIDNDKHSFSIEIPQGKTFTFSLIGSVCSGRDFTDPYGESDRQISYAAKEGLDRLLSAHQRLWDELWEGDVIIEGDDDAQRAVRFSLYNLYSSARKGSRLSIPPFGLSATGYNGHIFWDTELWMFPPMLFLNQGIARSMIDYRSDRLRQAEKRALAYGYDGAMFPWESDDSGEESCPVWALTGAFEHHITADIAIAAWNYYCMSADRRWLRDHGFPMMEKVADFWVSRAEKNPDGSYSVRNVVCADEYAIGVDDNAFTNGAAIKALQAAVKAAKVCGIHAPATWSEVASNLRIPKADDGTTLEYEGYAGQTIKQADVNLLGYPLAVITDPAQLKRDLEYYENKINPRGPAMSFAVFAIQHARLGDGDKAYELFVRSYRPNQLPPFGVVSEGAGGTNPYFTTGAGGFVQAVINGFCGLEITDNGIKQLPSALPSHWKKVTVTGVGPDKKTYTRSR
ncbi:MAG: glycoside hydrolase family 65 protein [Duncaniella sp.]|uniref:glycosyl hydrolase family 95 catalytic domain-containing protein n=1 Tax=Duncaniella sp. TaxID=2518496 RepID=UPI0023C9626C|nr:glycoside hydrolase family 65 protein [Duncaniella sp.]MDE5989773.1 glycoside hydrolase family 65 protein [Duncaniella sp.]